MAIIIDDSIIFFIKLIIPVLRPVVPQKNTRRGGCFSFARTSERSGNRDTGTWWVYLYTYFSLYSVIHYIFFVSSINVCIALEKDFSGKFIQGNADFVRVKRAIV